MALVGTEQIPVLGLSPNGNPASDTFITTTQAIANLGVGAGGFASPPALGNVTPNTVAATAITIKPASGPGTIESTTSNVALLSSTGQRMVQFLDGASGAAPGTYLQSSSGAAGSPAGITGSGSDTTHALNINSLFLALNGGTIVWSGSTNPTVLSTNSTVTGATTVPFAPTTNFNTTEVVDASGAAGRTISAYQFRHIYGGGTTKGGRLAVVITMNQAAAPADSGVQNGYTALTANCFGRYTIPGSTRAAPLGSIFGLNVQAYIDTGFVATNYFHVAGAEFDVGISAGSSAAVRSGLTIADLAGTTQGYQEDTNIWIYNGGSLGGFAWRYGMLFSGTQPWSLDASVGTMIGAYIGGASSANGTIPLTCQWGVDLGQVTFPSTGNPFDGGAFRTQGMSIDGVGTIQQGAAYHTPSGSGLDIDCKGSIGTSAAISVAGTGYAPVTAVTALGGVWLVTTSGGIPISVSQYRAPVYPSTSTPANPVATTNLLPTDSGSGLTLTITWNTTANNLHLQASGGTIQAGSGAFSANASVATALSSVGPVGSHTTVQEWFTIKNAAGTVRYIPAF